MEASNEPTFALARAALALIAVGAMGCDGGSPAADRMDAAPTTDQTECEPGEDRECWCSSWQEGEYQSTQECLPDGTWGECDCWQDTAIPETVFHTSDRRWSRVTAGSSNSCAIGDGGAVECWGCASGEDYGQCDPPEVAFARISAGWRHACGVLDDGGIACWGSNGHDQLAAPGGSFREVAAGDVHTCALGEDGAVACWGCGGGQDFGQCDPPDGGFRQVSAGAVHSCGVRDGGAVECWGCEDQDHGQCDPPDARMSQVDVGFDVTLGVLVDGGLACWGGAPGEDLCADTPSGGTATEVHAGADHACILRMDGTIRCWCAGGVAGWNPMLCDEPAGGGFVQLSVGTHTCALDADHHAVCWGCDLFAWNWGGCNVP